jgi:cytochrome P460
MKNYIAIMITSALVMSVVVIRQKAQAQNTGSQPAEKTDATIANVVQVETNNQESSPIYGVTIPPAYRDWKLIAVNQLLVPGKADQLRAQLGNDIAIKAIKEGTLPFPDGAIIAAIHWTRVPSEDNNQVLGGPFPGAQSFLVGSPVNAQFMVKDSKKYAATGGWGFADFKDGKPGSKALHETCFPCHAPAKDRDYVFTHYAP